jgi:hypothetical protein
MQPQAGRLRVWREQFDRWFAAPGTELMKIEVNVPLFFEVRRNANGRRLI